MPKKKQTQPERVTVPFSMPTELDERVEEAARRLGLNKQSTMRLSLERGIDVLIAQLERVPEGAASRA
jgi:predicted DNA-binding protein